MTWRAHFMELALNRSLPTPLRHSCGGVYTYLVALPHLTYQVPCMCTQTKRSLQTRAAIFTHSRALRIPGFRSSYRPQAPWPRIISAIRALFNYDSMIEEGHCKVRGHRRSAISFLSLTSHLVSERHLQVTNGNRVGCRRHWLRPPAFLKTRPPSGL